MEIRGDRPVDIKKFTIAGSAFNKVCESGDWRTIPVEYHPKKNCKKCFGRGFQGRIIRKGGEIGDYVVCPCTGLEYNGFKK